MSLASEAALSAIGFDNVLGAAPAYGQAQRAKAATLTKRARALILRFMAGSTDVDEPEQGKFNYEAIDEALRNIGEKQAAALLSVNPDPDLQADVTRIATFLQNSFTRRVIKTLVKETVLPPEAFELGRLRRKWAVAIDPLSVLRDLVTESIDSGSVTALEEMWPEFFKALTSVGGIVDDAIAVMKARRGLDKWDLTLSRDRLLRVLMQVPDLNTSLANDYARIAAAPLAQPEAKGAETKPIKVQNSDELPGQKSPTQ